MNQTARPTFVIEFELGCALELRDIYAGRPDCVDMISRFQADQNRREIERLTAELETARTQT